MNPRTKKEIRMQRITLLAGLGLLAIAGAPALAAAPTPGLVENLPRFLGRLHPMVVHFPIALLLAAVLFEVFAIVVRRQRNKPSPAAVACVLIGALGAGAAAWFGWINADLEPHGRGVSDLIEVHRWMGIATVVLAGVALVAAAIGATGRARAMTAVYRIALVLAAGLVGVAGHWGGSIVYGEGYLTEALFPRPEPVPVDVETQLAQLEASGTTLTVDFATQIAPIFANHCVECHGPEKKKGNLRLDARHFVFDQRDADEQVIIPGDALASDLHFRISLPADDEDVMPPEGKAEPLTPEQIALVETWINEGAVWSDVPIVMPGAEVAADEPEAEAPFVFDEAQQAAQAGAIARLRERGAVATRVSESDPWVEVRFDLIGKSVTDADLALLQGLEPTLLTLNLAGTGVTDEGLAAIAPFTRLERLHLDRTAITDAGLDHIAPLEQVRYLNLYGTGVTDQGLVAAARLPRLERLYLWRTNVTPQAGALLAALKPGLEVDVSSTLTPASFDQAPENGAVAGTPGASDAAEPQADAQEDATEAAAEEAKVVLANLPGCCKAALERGAECDHPCCVEARLAGKICETCSN